MIRTSKFVLAGVLLGPSVLDAQTAQSDPFASLRFRSIGPAAIGGRIHDVEALPTDPSTVYVASASGGLWKSTNHGTTWTPIFENQPVSTFGDLAIAPSNNNILYAGTGEQNNRQSTSWGNGVYRSNDGGKTWTHLGLDETRHIGRVLIHATNPDIAWVAALGNLWKASPERGVFKTTDGGRTWSKTLFVDTLTGAVDMEIDPRDANTLYAAAYQRMRTAWGFNGGGTGSGIYKSSDGGATWRQLTNGIPQGDKGRIGLAIAESNPRVVMATIEHASEGGTYRSEDAGESWTRVSRVNPRPMYYSKIFIDPTTDQRVYLLGVSIVKSEDGGRNFRTMPTAPTYDVGLKSDHHSMWIDPRDPKHWYVAGDGGLHVTFDMGETYQRINNIPIGQFYAIGADQREPYWIYGGMQDNHSWMGPSATRHWLGIINEDWKEIGFGDGMYAQVDLGGHRYVYTNAQNGSLQRFDAETGDRLNIEPVAPAGERPYRWDWVTPSVASRHAPGTVYFGGNRLFISRDRGLTWTRTADLTRQVNRDTLRIMGVLGSEIRLSRNDGEQSFSEITSMAESPLDARVLWVGTDDGNVQVSQDGGATWTEVSGKISGEPDGALVSRVVASRASRGTAYVTFDHHRAGDFRPYVFRTTNFGNTWTAVSRGLPQGSSVRALHEYPGKANVLFLGTEHSLFVTHDSGSSWKRFMPNLPTTRYDDILVHPRDKDLILGTHGRSIWVLDDASAVADWSPTIASRPAHIFPVRAATIFQYWEDYSYRGSGAYAGENPPDGAIVTYHLAGTAPTAAQVTITNASGRTVRRLTAPAEGGLVHRIAWDLRHDPPPSQPDTNPAARLALPRPTHVLSDRGPFVSPGMYTVSLEAGDARATATIRVNGDPLLPVTLAQHREREAFLLEVRDVQRRVWDLAERIVAARRTVAGDQARADSLAALERRVRGGAPGAPGGAGGGGGFGGNLRSRAYGLAGEFNGSGVRQGSLYPPTADHRRRLKEIKDDLERSEKTMLASAPAR